VLWPFQKRKGAAAGAVWRKWAAVLGWLHPEEEESRAGSMRQ
jgi:hypothetical protein